MAVKADRLYAVHSGHNKGTHTVAAAMDKLQLQDEPDVHTVRGPQKDSGGSRQAAAGGTQKKPRRPREEGPSNAAREASGLCMAHWIDGDKAAMGCCRKLCSLQGTSHPGVSQRRCPRHPGLRTGQAYWQAFSGGFRCSLLHFPAQSAGAAQRPQVGGSGQIAHSLLGQKHVQLSFHGHQFSWIFLLADTNFTIMGADFPRHHHLLLEIANDRLVDADHRPFATVAATAVELPPCGPARECQGGNAKVNRSTTLGGLRPSVEALIARPDSCEVVGGGLLPEEWLADFLMEFDDVVCPSKVLPAADDRVQHHVLTTGPPIAARFRCLDTEKLEAASFSLRRMG